MTPALVRAVCGSGLIAGSLLLGAMTAERPPVSDSPEEWRPPERLDDPWLPRDPALGSAPTTPVLQGQFLSIQVNIDADGLNIIGDAANEPSIGVDPTAPNRIVSVGDSSTRLIPTFDRAVGATATTAGALGHSRACWSPASSAATPWLMLMTKAGSTI